MDNNHLILCTFESQPIGSLDAIRAEQHYNTVWAASYYVEVKTEL